MAQRTITVMACDRCGHQLSIDERDDMSQALWAWIVLEARDAVSRGLTGADVPQTTLLCTDCRGAFVRWLKA